jgi:hypothetical protein
MPPEAFRTYDNMPRWLPTLPGLLPESTAPMPRLRVAGAVLIDDLLLGLGGNFGSDIQL